MSANVLYDTLKLSKALQEADFTPVQAEALADSGQDNDATKEDITNLRADLIAKFADLKVETVRRIVGAIAFNFIGTAGLIIALARTFGR